MHTTREEAIQQFDAVRRLFRRQFGLVTLGLTMVDDDWAVAVLLEEPLRQGIVLPERVNGVPIKVTVVGQIRLLAGQLHLLGIEL